jgi:hypothetical protein
MINAALNTTGIINGKVSWGGYDNTGKYYIVIAWSLTDNRWEISVNRSILYYSYSSEEDVYYITNWVYFNDIPVSNVKIDNSFLSILQNIDGSIKSNDGYFSYKIFGNIQNIDGSFHSDSGSFSYKGFKNNQNIDGLIGSNNGNVTF